MEFFECIPQGIVLVGVYRVESCEYLGLDFLKARQGFGSRRIHQSDSIANTRVLELLDTSDDEADLASRQLLAGAGFRRKHPDLLAQVLGMRRHQQNFVFGLENAVDHTHQHHHADVVIEPRVDNQRFQRCRRISLGGRNTLDHRLQNILNANTGFCAGVNRISRGYADNFLNFCNDAFRLSGRQVNLVQHRHYFDALLGRRITICHRLGFHALRSINNQQSPLASSQGA